jgi:hypothetical protein
MDKPAKTAFNKENAPELLGQLVRVLESQGMEDSLDALKRCGITRKLNDEWMGDTRNRQKRKRDRRAAERVDPEMLKAWKRHVLRSQRRWGRHDADDWLDEAISYAEEYWKAMNLDPGDDVPMREVERWAEKQAPGLIAFWGPVGKKMASASRVATAHTAAKVYSLRDFQRKAADVDKAVGAAYMEALGLKGMWDTFEAIPSKQEPLYDGNMKTMNGLRDAQTLSGDVYFALKRYR